MPGVNVQRKEMAHFHSQTTFCEVTYDSDWLNYDDDRHYTPYRYSLMRNNDVETNSDTVSLTLPSYTYYEYLRSLYDCRTTPSRAPPGYQGPAGAHIVQQGRATTWHAFNKENGSEFSRQAIRSEPTRIRPTYPFPTLHLMQGGDGSGDELDDDYIYADRTNEKLVWVDALNKWVPQKQLHPRPYMSFIGNVPVIEKQGRCTKEKDGDWRAWSAPAWIPSYSEHMYVPLARQIETLSVHQSVLVGGGDDDDEKIVQPCPRFEVHMGKQPAVETPPTKTVNKSTLDRDRNNEKREIIRKRAQELAEQKKQRKAYSTPLYTSKNERKQNMKPRVQSSRTHSSLPVSPVVPKVPSPKQVWQPDEGPKLRTIHEPKAEPDPVKKEISITLISPQPEDLDEDKDLDDLKGSDKKVTFTDQLSDKDTVKSSKKSKEDDLASNHSQSDEALAAKLEEQRLIESLEKQRLMQIEQQQKLLAEEERRKAMERKEKERLAEEERLRKIRESQEKQNALVNSNNLDKLSESTVGAAGKRRKGKGNASKSQPKPAKVEKVPKKSKKDEEKFVEKKSNAIPQPKKEPSTNKSTKNLVPKPPKEPKPKKEPSNPKPMLAGVGKPGQQVTGLSQVTVDDEREKLPITKPTEVEPVVEEEVVKPKSPAQERRKSIVEQREIIKKERRDGRKCVKKPEEEVKEALPEPDIVSTKVESWIYGADDYSEKTDEDKEESVHVETEPLPTLSGDLNPEFIERQKREKKEKRRKGVLANLLGTEKAVKKWKKPDKDSSYADELRRLELAEERRKRQMEMFERLKNRKHNLMGEVDDDGTPRFEDYGFLAKYCIFTKGNIDMYRHAFEAVDEDKSGWLEGEDVMIALRGVNNKLTEAEEEYLYRVLELTGYKITHGADFKIFSVLAALSQRISALDKWMKNLIGKMDFKALEMKMFKCKTLWECNVDKETNSISIDQLCVDLRAGGVSFEHEMEVREKLAHLHSIDLLDFLTYIPLFIMIHEAVVQNPLSDVRDK